MTPGEEKSLEETPTRNLQAYDCYLRAKFHADHHDRSDIDASIRLLERAVALDPAFAEAYAHLAQMYTEKGSFLEPQRKLWEEKAVVTVEKALALDPDLPEARLARARILWTPSNHFPHELAIKESRRALELNPHLDEARLMLARVYNHIGLFAQAHQELRQALEIDPVNPALRLQIALTLHYEGKHEQAVAALEACPRDVAPVFWERVMAASLAHLGRRQEAWARIQRFLKSEAADEGGQVVLIQLLRNFLDEHDLGIVLAPDGTLRLGPGLVRLPDVAFLSWDRFPDRELPAEPIPDLAPDLAVEVLSQGNTEAEMQRKLQEYFAAGVRLMWYVDSAMRTARVYTSLSDVCHLSEEDALDGSAVLPGFRLTLRDWFERAGPRRGR